MNAAGEPIAVSDRARELLRGAYDTHIHVSPDVVPRIVDDVTLARRFANLGMDGFILKSHYTSTAERAGVVRAAVPGIQALGAIALNRAVGGMNALAVEVAAREGARTVWLPTVDSVNESDERDAPAGRDGVKVPVWVKLQLELREQGIEIPPVPVVDDGGAVLPETQAVLERIAHHGLLLATGHLARDEIFTVVDAALDAGVEEIVITHPEFPAQSLNVEDQQALAAKGALLERCMTTPFTGKIAWEEWINNIRACGPEHSVLSTDLGQVFNPPVQDGMGIMVDRLLDAGFNDEEVQVMAVANTRRVAGAEPW
jgi:stage V sporulation protein SpoVS